MMDLKNAGIKERMLAGETLVGTFIQTPHPAVVEFVGGLGFDFVCLEAEHSAMGAETIQGLATAADCTPCETLVRIANNDWFLVAGALDAGAAGVICPRVNTASEAEAFVRSALYPPLGDRASARAGDGLRLQRGPDYRLRANERNLVAVQVETRQAMENLADIVALPGLDMVFVGPADLASSLALPDGRSGTQEAWKDLRHRTGAGKLCGSFAETLSPPPTG